MKPTNDGAVRTIHPEVINEIGMEAAVEMLAVGRDLRDGTISDKFFDMRIVHEEISCGTSHCIAGWVAFRMKKDYKELFTKNMCCWTVGKDGRSRLNNLFSTNHPNDCRLAADAIDRYIYDYALKPWHVT